MNSAFRLREATIDDSASISSLLEELGHHLSPQLVAGQLRRIASLNNGYFVIVGTTGDRVVGLASGFPTPVLHREFPVGRLSLLVVANSHIGQGLGSMLLREAEKRLLQQGCIHIELTTASHRKEAHEFYRHKGYREQGLRFSRELITEESKDTAQHQL